MANCGIPTFTCVLLLLFMAALYASVSAKHAEDRNSYKLDQALDNRQLDTVQVRMARSIDLEHLNSRTNLNNRGRQGRIADSGITEVGGGGVTSHGDPNRRRRPRPDGGRRRGSGGGGGRRRNRNEGRLPVGVNRRMMRLAERLHDASSPFAARLFSTLFPTVDNNAVVSPFSVHTALSMTAMGARRRTKREMEDVLGLKDVRLRNMKAHQAYQGLITSLGSVHQDVHIYTANAVFVRPNIPLEISFREGLSQMYNAEFDSFNFDHPVGAEGAINAFVANATRDRIQDLLPPGTITALTTMILVNAVYFNASWEYPFNTRLTRPEEFQSLNQGVKSVDMMRRTGFFNYANHFNTEVVEIPYSGGRLAMYILLPSHTSDLARLVQDFGNTDQYGANPVQHLFEGLTSTNLKLILPKFRVESDRLELKPALQSLGIERAFDERRADFSGISASTEMYIGKVIHKAFIDVNEAGTEAAAATAVVMLARSGIRGADIPEVKVDRPFLFAIRDNLTKVLLFVGTYVGH